MPEDTQSAEDYQGQLRATILAERREDPDTGETLDAGAPTQAELRTINRRFARRSLSAEDVYVLPVYMSGTGLDSHGTHQDLTSLRNYKRDVTQTDAVPMLAHHGGLLGGQLDPIGRWFAAAVQKLEQPAGGALEWNERQERYLLLVDEQGQRALLGKHFKDKGYALHETGYMLRGTSPNGQPVEDLIRRVDGGTQRDTSIGFTLNPAVAPGAHYLCDICGLDLFDRRCAHIPLLRYQDPYNSEQTVLGTAAVVGARQVEGSLVWRGSYPGAFVARAARLYAEGQVAQQDVALLEHYYGARIVGSGYISIPKGAEAMADERTEDQEQPEAEAAEGERQDEQPAAADAGSLLERAQEPEAEPAEDEVEDERVETLERDLAAAEEAEQALREQISATLRSTGLEAPNDPQDAVRMLGVLAAEGMHSRSQLVEACVQERVRADGATSFDGDAYRQRLSRLPIAELEDELRDQAGASGSAWTLARQTATEIRQRAAEEAGDGQPQERQLTAAELFSLRGA